MFLTSICKQLSLVIPFSSKTDIHLPHSSKHNKLYIIKFCGQVILKIRKGGFISLSI